MRRSSKQYWRSFAAVLVIVLGSMAGATIPPTHAIPDTNQGVLPTHAKAHGKSYGDWGAKWWQWALSFPAADIPFLNTGGPVDISAGQSGKVWFLAGANLGQTSPRTGKIPPGTYLFIPLINFLNDYPCPPEFGFEPETGETLEQFLQRTGNDFLPFATDLFAEIDGVPLENLSSYRVTSRLFTFTADPAIAATLDPCITGNPQPGVSVGYWLMLSPLPPGTHTLHFGAPSYGQDITYQLTVER